MKKLLILLVSFSLISFIFPEPSKKLNKILKGNWALVPAGDVFIAGNKAKTNDFYILKTEVSNLDYLRYLSAIKNTTAYAEALPDTTVWTEKPNLNNGYTLQYLRYPGFRLYPVVGVSWTQAVNYCKWLEGEMNKNLDAGEKVKVRLPSEQEWIRAARGDNHAAFYTWGRPNLKDGKGRYLANCRIEKEEIFDSKYDKHIITANVFNYHANTYKIFQMNGNVSEMIDKQGVTKGGSWLSHHETLKIENNQNQEYPTNDVGFRPVLTRVMY